MEKILFLNLNGPSVCDCSDHQSMQISIHRDQMEMQELKQVGQFCA